MILLTLATACSSPQFTQQWLIDRTRVLAVRAEPPEPAPGAVVTLSALVVDPDGDPEVAWVACSLPVDCPDYAAVQELAAADTGAMTSDELAAWQADATAAGFLGFGVGLSPTLLVLGAGPPDGGPDTGLPDTGFPDTGSAPRSSELTVVLDAIPAGKGLADVTLGDAEATEIGTKSISVADSETPNQNPTVTSLSIDGESEATVSRGEAVSLEATLADGSAESYADADGETQTEEPTVSYYVSGGTLVQSIVAADDAEVSWTAPESSGTVRLWAIVRDGRGGTDWLVETVTVE
ncbi:MAG: hypothetical protein Q8P18_26955 [Pseudomonadota bacterium]|nr:hypothetical protein [Pseudomonadota bacterium]